MVDPFSGSGTVADQCIRTGRNFVGADLFYEDVRRKRLAAVSPDLVSVLPGVTDDSIAVWQAEARAIRHDARPLVATVRAQLEAETMDLFVNANAA